MDDDSGALPLKQEFSAWYNDLLWRAEIMDVRYPVKGLYVWFPYGFALRKHVYQRLRDLLDRDHQETKRNPDNRQFLDQRTHFTFEFGILRRYRFQSLANATYHRIHAGRSHLCHAIALDNQGAGIDKREIITTGMRFV